MGRGGYEVYDGATQPYKDIRVRGNLTFFILTSKS